MGRLFRYVLALPKRYTVGGLILLLLVIIGVHYVTRTPSAPATPPGIPSVHLSSVAGLSSQTGPLPVVGTVTSLNTAVILAQAAGQVTVLNRQLGDRVAAGEIIAELENSSQQAAVLEAQGSYDAAVAALAKAQGSSAANSTITSSAAQQTAMNDFMAALSSLQSTYAALDDAVHTKTDALFSNPHSQVPTFLLTVPDNQLVVTMQNQRSGLDAVIADAAAQQSPSMSSLDASVAQMTADTQTIEAFLGNVVEAVNEAQPNPTYTSAIIATDQTTAAAARTEVVNAVAALTAAKNTYDAAQSSAQSAANSATGGTTNDIDAAKANVEETLGALDSAKASLEKTIIRSPISGTLVSLSLTQGGYVSNSAQVAEVSNPGALEVDTSVTPEDAKTLAVGGKALINGTTAGIITSIAPALDPTTNMIPVKIGITGSASALTDGETASLSLSRTTPTSDTSTNTAGGIEIPIIAANITPEGPVVFSVSASSTLIAHPIVLGSILGDTVMVESGLTPDMAIVTDARGLSDGEAVIVEQ